MSKKLIKIEFEPLFLIDDRKYVQDSTKLTSKERKQLEKLSSGLRHKILQDLSTKQQNKKRK